MSGQWTITIAAISFLLSEQKLNPSADDACMSVLSSAVASPANVLGIKWVGPARGTFVVGCPGSATVATIETTLLEDEEDRFC